MVPHDTYPVLDRAMDFCPECGYFTLHHHDKRLEKAVAELKDSATVLDFFERRVPLDREGNK